MRPLRNRLAAGIALPLVVLSLIPGRAHAQPTTQDSAAILVRAALSAQQQGSPASLEESIRLYQRALPLFRAAGDGVSEGGTLSYIADGHRALGRPDSALAYYARAVRVLRPARDGRGEGAALARMGAVHLQLGRADSARIFSARALSVLHDAGDRRGEAAMLDQMGTAHQALGRADSARTYFGRALAVWRELGNTRGEAVTLTNLGMTFQDAARADSAQQYFAQALGLLRQNADHGGEGATLGHLAALWARRGNEEGVRRAAGYWGQAGDAYLAGELPSLAAAAWDSAGRAYERIGARDSALAWMGQAIALRDTTLIEEVDSLMRSSPVLLQDRTMPEEARFIAGVRRLLARIRGRPTPEEEVLTTAAAQAVLEELNAHRLTSIEVQAPSPTFPFGYRRWLNHERASPDEWMMRTAASPFTAPRKAYEFRYIHPETGRDETFTQDCSNSPCIVHLPRLLPAP